MMGDAIHNLKTALDYAWFQTISISNYGSVRPKFPIYPSCDQLKMALIKGGIGETTQLYILLVAHIKPYDGGNFYLRPLHQLDIMDKHELLIPSTNYGNVVGLKVKDQYGPVNGGTWGQELSEDFHIDFRDDIEVQDNGRATFGIVFKEGPMKNFKVSDVLKDFRGTVLAIVELMEKLVEVC
jgi:hypothetical protein